MQTGVVREGGASNIFPVSMCFGRMYHDLGFLYIYIYIYIYIAADEEKKFNTYLGVMVQSCGINY